jgi:DNA-binding transcriptional ArsR family regulator
MVADYMNKRDVFQAVADSTRRRILRLSALKPMTPNELAEHFDTSRQAVSKHIKILAESSLLKKEHSGREIYYRLNPGKMKEIDKWLEPFRLMWEERFDELDRLLKRDKNKKKE